MFATKKLKAVVLGVGHMGTLHAKHLKTHPQWELTGVYDLREDVTQNLAQELETQALRSLAEVWERAEAVFIATPTASHYELASQALEQGCHVFIEKPMTTTVDEARALVEQAIRVDKKIQVGHIERFNPALEAIRGIALQPRFIEAHRLAPFVPRGMGNDVVSENMIHDIDILLNLVGSPLKKVSATGVAVVGRFADIANARLEFANGCIANVTASRISLQKMRKMRIFQEKSYLTLDFLQGFAEVYQLVANATKVEADRLIPLEGTGKYIAYRKLSVPATDALSAEQTAFARAILEDRAPLIDGQAGLQAIKAAALIRQELQPHL